MLSALPTTSRQHDMPAMPILNKTWERDMQQDMKEAIDLLFKFKESLDKLHPECTRFIERMMQFQR